MEIFTVAAWEIYLKVRNPAMVAPSDQTPDNTLNKSTLYQSDHNDHQGPSGFWLILTVPSLQTKTWLVL